MYERPLRSYIEEHVLRHLTDDEKIPFHDTPGYYIIDNKLLRLHYDGQKMVFSWFDLPKKLPTKIVARATRAKKKFELDLDKMQIKIDMLEQVV